MLYGYYADASVVPSGVARARLSSAGPAPAFEAFEPFAAFVLPAPRALSAAFWRHEDVIAFASAELGVFGVWAPRGPVSGLRLNDHVPARLASVTLGQALLSVSPGTAQDGAHELAAIFMRSDSAPAQSVLYRAEPPAPLGAAAIAAGSERALVAFGAGGFAPPRRGLDGLGRGQRERRPRPREHPPLRSRPPALTFPPSLLQSPAFFRPLAWARNTETGSVAKIFSVFGGIFRPPRKGRRAPCPGRRERAGPRCPRAQPSPGWIAQPSGVFERAGGLQAHGGSGRERMVGLIRRLSQHPLSRTIYLHPCSDVSQIVATVDDDVQGVTVEPFERVWEVAEALTRQGADRDLRTLGPRPGDLERKPPAGARSTLRAAKARRGAPEPGGQRVSRTPVSDRAA